jgi:hypothetical protein
LVAQQLKGKVLGENEKEADAYDSQEKRAAMRQQLVARAAAADLSTDPMLNAHKGENKKVDLGMPVADEGDIAEDVFDVRKKVDQSLSKSVKKQAGALHEAIRKGLISEASLDSLVSLGAADAEAVKYYREFYGKVDSEFASKLTSDFKKSASNDQDVLAVRYKRAYKVAMDAQSKGLVSQGSAALDEMVDSLVAGTDVNFEAFKRMVANVKPLLLFQ